MLSMTSALADDAAAGWSRKSDGTYVHDLSGIACAPDVAGYTFKRLDGPSAPNFEGVCVYEKGSEAGLIRVRRYQAGVGETPLAIQNDEGLMHPDSSQGHIVSAFRAGPGPVVDGIPSFQMVMTSIARGYLFDCIARHTEKSMPPQEFALACMKLRGG